MSFLYLLESVRNPVLDVLMQAVTELGGATLFIVFGMLMFWCVDKRQGYFLLTVGLAGTFLNQFLKISCRVPRPWVRDPAFTIVESARADAAGYSFPSGHSQIAVGTYGGLALCRREKWVRIVGTVLAVLIPFSPNVSWCPYARRCAGGQPVRVGAGGGAVGTVFPAWGLLHD